MNKILKKIIRNIIKKSIYFFIIFSFIFSNIPLGLFDYYLSKIKDRNIVDQMWLSINNNNVIDSFSLKDASAAEVTIESDLTDATDDFGPSPTVVFTTNQTGYLFFVDAGNDLVYRKTTNGGTNWTTPVVIDNVLTGWTTVSVWYDQWTPGDSTGTKVHIAAADTTTGDAYYTYLDTNGDTLKGSVVSVIPQTTFTAEANAAPSITKGRGGDLFLTANFATTAGGYVYKSSDGAGNSWSDITPSGWSSVSLDQIQILPLYTDNDIIAIKAETASNAIKYQVYDEVLDSWAGTWTNIGSLTEHATYDQWFSATVNKINGDIYLSFNNYTNNAANDIEFWSFSNNTRIFTKKTNIRSDNAQLLSPVPIVDENTGDVYVAYIEGQTNFVYNGMGVNSITYIYYQKTTDGGDTWGSRQGVLTNDVGDDYKYLRGNISSTNRLFVAYYDDDDDDIWGTTIYSSAVPVEANIDTAIVDATDEFGASPTGVFLDEDIGYQFFTRTNVMLDATDEFGASPSVVFTDANTGYIFFVDSPSQDLVYRKTIDGGITWGGSIIIDTTIAGWTSVSVWYDQWTSGDTTGTKIHITASDDASDDIYYTYLDTNGDNLKGSMVMAVSGTTTLTEAVDGPPTITKGAGGYLFIAGNFTSTVGGKVSKSIDGSGNTWTNITPAGWSSVAADQIQLLPLLTDNDILAIRADTTNNDMDYQVYDEVLDSWAGSWTTIASMVDNTTYTQWFSATLKKSTGDVYLTFTNNIAVATGDIEFWSFSDASRTFTKSTTNVVSDLATILTPVPFYKEDTGTIYVAYTRGTLAGTMHVYFKSSTDGGATWSAESSALSTTGDDFKGLRGNMMSSSNLYVAWYNDDTNVIKGDKILSIQSYDLPINGVQSVVYRKTINGGGEWGPPYTIANMVGATAVSIWYDRWTPGDTTGTKIHIAFSDDQTDDHYYSSFDTSNNKITPPIPVLLGTAITEAADGPPSITKGGGGDLFITGNFTTTAGGKISKSSNGGLNWTDITPSGWSSVAIDQIQILPLSTDNDIIAIKAETASNAIKYQVYDEVLDSWAGTWTTIGTMVENTTYDQWFSASLKKSTGDIYLTFANQTNNAANDIEFWSLPDNTRTFSKGVDVYSDTANVMMPVTLIDELSGDIYVAYLRGTLANTMNVYFKKSTDGGASWSVESNTLSPGIYDDLMSLHGNILSDNKLYVFWYNDDLNDVYGNRIDDIFLGSSLPVVSTQDASSILSTTSVGNGTIVSNGGENNTKRGFVYGDVSRPNPGNVTPTNSNYVYYIESTGSFGVGSFSGNLIGLSSGVTYYVRAYSYNSVGYSYGNEVSFTTLSIPLLTTEVATSITQTTATLNGNITSTGGTNPTVRGFEYGLTTSYGTTTTENGDFGTGAYTANITSLTCNTTYHYRSYATNSIGTGYGSDQTFITSECPPTIGVVASGGTESIINVGGLDYKVHTFLSSGNFTVTTGGIIEYLVVGGGGGGGITPYHAGGGGGGGGVLEDSINISNGVYPITVGQGGQRGYTSGATVVQLNTNGGNSSIDTLVVAIGGGAGGGNVLAGNGGSGGGGVGGASTATYPGGTGTVGQGYNGGTGQGNTTTSFRASGGGGGASEIGQAATNDKGGDGGDGIQSSINGTATYYGGGGGGSKRLTGSIYQGLGGLGGGGDGGYQITAEYGTTNTGGGGGGVAGGGVTMSSGDGGSGIVIIRYPIVANPIFSQSDYRFFENENGDFVSSSMETQNTGILLSESGDNFRLRMILKVEDSSVSIGGNDFKLQFAEKSGSCDTSFAGESYLDISYDTDIAYYDNFYPEDGVALTSNVLDPTISGTIVNQSYVESNPFTNLFTINNGQYGMWDFSLYDKSISNNVSYCFRVVNSDNELLNNYYFVPEITTAVYRSRGGGSVRHITNTLCDDNIDNDSDTYIDENDPNCHMNGELGNIYLSDWNSETVSPGIIGGGDEDGGGEVVLPLCSDTLDNDTDTYIDTLDPQCHIDGNINNSYVPEWNSETTAPVSETGGGSGDTGGDLGFIINNKLINFPDLSKFKDLLLAMVFNIF